MPKKIAQLPCYCLVISKLQCKHQKDEKVVKDHTLINQALKFPNLNVHNSVTTWSTLYIHTTKKSESREDKQLKNRSKKYFMPLSKDLESVKYLLGVHNPKRVITIRDIIN